MPGEEGGCQLSSLPLSPPFPSQCSPEELPVGSSHSLGAFGVHALQGHPETLLRSTVGKSPPACSCGRVILGGLTNEGGLEEGLRAAEALVPDGDDLPVRELIALLQ